MSTSHTTRPARAAAPHPGRAAFRTAHPGRAGAAAALALALAAVPAQSASAGSAPIARGARTISLNESANMRLTSKHGFTLNEQGEATGTARGAIYVHLTIVSSSRVRAEVNLYPHNGSISSRGSASYHRGKTSASFAGKLSIQRGSGAYSRARGQGLSFSGTIQRSNDAISVHVSGRVTD